MFVSIGGEVQLKWKTEASEMKCKKPVNINLLKIPFDGYPAGNWLLLRFALIRLRKNNWSQGNS